MLSKQSLTSTIVTRLAAAQKHPSEYNTGTFLYAELLGSASLVLHRSTQTSSKLHIAYMSTCSQLIKAYGGQILSFEENKVQAMFSGSFANTNACICAQALSWAIETILIPEATRKFASAYTKPFSLHHKIGIDTGGVTKITIEGLELIRSKARIISAALAQISENIYSILITKACHDLILEKARKHDGKSLWNETEFEIEDSDYLVYGTNTKKEPLSSVLRPEYIS